MVDFASVLAGLLGGDFFEVGRLPRARNRPIARFLRAFRKAPGLEAVAVASEQFRALRWWRFSISDTAKWRAR